MYNLMFHHLNCETNMITLNIREAGFKIARTIYILATQKHIYIIRRQKAFIPTASSCKGISQDTTPW